MRMYMRHPSNPDNVAATDQLAYNNVWKKNGWELVESKDGEWVAIGKKAKKTSSGSSATVTEPNSED